MTVERDGYNGPVVFRCDGARCHEYAETHCTDWTSAIAKIKSRGWSVRLVGGEWQHICRGCAP